MLKIGWRQTLPHARFLVGASILTAGQGGICRLARLTTHALVDEGYSPKCFSLLDPTPPRDLRAPVKLFGGNQALFAAASYLEALDRTHFFYDHLGTARAHPRVPGLRKPFGVWACGIEVWEGARADRLAAARRADLLISISSYTKQRAVTLHGPVFERAEVCWLATEEDEPPADPPRFDGPPTALVLGRMDEGQYKGHRELIDCWPRVVKVVPEARLLIVGGGTDLDAVRAFAGDSPAAASIEVTGFVPEERIEAVWRRAHMFAMPSRGEGFGLVYIEAMRRGLPVIASVHDAAPEVNLDGLTGYNVDLDRPDELSERIIQLLRDPDHARRLGQAGQARWAEHFRYGAFRERFADVIRRFLAAGSTPD